VQRRCLSSVGAVASSSGSALHQKAGKTAGSRGCEDPGARLRVRCVTVGPSSFCTSSFPLPLL
jgi:hypothetical protein